MSRGRGTVGEVLEIEELDEVLELTEQVEERRVVLQHVGEGAGLAVVVPSASLDGEG